MQPLELAVPRTARYYALGDSHRPGPSPRPVWFCLHAHGQPVAELAQHLAPLAVAGPRLILPEGLSRHALPPPPAASLAADVPALAPQTGAVWFAPDSLLPDLADLTGYLDLLAAEVLARHSPEAVVTVVGFGEGAAAACRWLAGGRQPYARLVLYDPVFPPDIDRRAAFVSLPERPVLVLQTLGAAGAADAAAEPAGREQLQEALLADLAAVGLQAEQRLLPAGTSILAALQPLLAAGSAGPA